MRQNSVIPNLDQTIEKASKTLSDVQHPEGYWWFTLEANEAIGAGYIQLTHFLGCVDKEIEKGIVNRILQVQHEDGSWGLYFGSAGDLSTTIECYFSLRLAQFPKDHPSLLKTKEFILSKGGLTKMRAFTRIHLALFGLLPWDLAPALPLEMMFLPPWAPFNIYNFSSWARASIVPLLVVVNMKPVVAINIDLEELYVEAPSKRKWDLPRSSNPLSIEKLFSLIDRGLKYVDKIPVRPWKTAALEKAILWTWEHLQKTRDIYPAMAYGAMAFKAFGYANNSRQIQTALNGLKSFQQSFVGPELPSVPLSIVHSPSSLPSIHQQCCISPVWDTPWSLVALMEADHRKCYNEHLLKSGRWLLSKEIQNPNGDWRHKNPEGKAGGWSFEFLNEYFPDTDDTIEVLTALHLLAIPEGEKKPAFDRGLNWLLSMQNDDGGFGAFDKNNDLELVNKIPFSDHGACLDPSTPDITGRVLELLLRLKKDYGLWTMDYEPTVKKIINYLKNSQEKFGGWYGRWGVNYIYGTWGVLTGLSGLGDKNPLKKESEKACDWLESIQNPDGGFSESPESYTTKQFKSYPKSVPSQTAWGVMGLIAGGRAKSQAVQRAIQFLIDHCENGIWKEDHFTGTGFPGHFYIRYHGYRYYFPLLALARYRKAVSQSP